MSLKSQSKEFTQSCKNSDSKFYAVDADILFYAVIHNTGGIMNSSYTLKIKLP